MAQKTWGIVVAAGKEQQIAQTDAAFLTLGGRPVVFHSLKAMEEAEGVDAVAVVVPKERMVETHRMIQMMGLSKVRKIVAGANLFILSVCGGLEVISDDCTAVVIQEALHPLVGADLIDDVVKTGRRYGAAQAAWKVTEGVKHVPKGFVVRENEEPGAIWLARSPMACKRDIIEKALEERPRRKWDGYDLADLLSAVDIELRVVPSDRKNLCIRAVDDLGIAEALIKV